MKQLLIVCAAGWLCACSDAASTETKKDSTAAGGTEMPAKKSMPEMPYQLDKPYSNWQPGDPQHAATVMTSLKGFETNDMAKCASGFADSVKIYFDGWEGKYSRDSLMKMFGTQRNLFTAYSVKMEDWESVISEDKKEQWVTLWYKQYMTDKKGKVDSAACINDAMIKDGKIVVLSESTRHYPAKK